MARPLRVEFPGACYHVINRGNSRFPVFGEDRDRELVLEKLVEFAERFGVSVRAYCVLINHFHCYLQTEEANLGRFMQSFLTSFSLSYNRRQGTSGHVFRGRYKAFLVEDDRAYRDRVSRYIHLNPACIPSLRDAETMVRQRAIRDFHWSSYAAAIGLRRCPRWLDRNALLAGFPGKLRERQQAYARYVEPGLTEDMWDPYEAAAAQTVIGSDSFVDRIRRSLCDLSENINVRRESVQQRALRSGCDPDEVVEAVAEQYGCSAEQLLRRHSKNNEARQVLLYLAATYCRGRYSLVELGERLGSITVSGLGSAYQKMACRLRQSESVELRKRVGLIEAVIADAKRNSGD